MKKLLLILTLMFSVLGFSQPSNWNGTTWIAGGFPNNSNDIVNINSGIYNGVGFEGGDLNINTGATLIITNGQSVTVNGTFTINTGGTVIVESGGNFNHQGTTQIINGTFIVKVRPSSPKSFEFTYWSSPINNGSTSSIDVLINRYVLTAWGEPFNSDTWNWLAYNVQNNIPMAVGYGYAIRGADWANSDVNGSHGNIANAVRYNNLESIFTGTPNTGTISPNESGTLFLVGNPYPCNIDIDSFFNQNSNVNNIYLWTHNSLPDNGNPRPYVELYSFNNGDYAIANRTDFTPASNTIGVGGSLQRDNQGNINGGITTIFNDAFEYENTSVLNSISVGQGFFVDRTNPTISVIFNNSMKTTSASTFNKISNNVSKSRIRVTLNGEGVKTFYTLGYIEGSDATENFDPKYDFDIMNESVHPPYLPYLETNSLYSNINSNIKLKIDGRSIFNDEDFIPLGVNLHHGGQYTFNLGFIDQNGVTINCDGIFANPDRDIYLEDTTTHITYNLKLESPTFTLNAGLNEGRFILKFTNSTLGNSDNVVTSSNTVIYSNYGINIKNDLEKINKVSIFDTVGRQVHSGTYNDNSVNIKLEAKGVYIVKVLFENGQGLTRKIIN